MICLAGDSRSDIINMFIHMIIFMKKTAVFTTTISAQLLEWLKDESKSEKITMRAVLEKAIKNYMIEAKRQKYIESFKRAALDPEMLELAEMGMDDYYENLKPYL